MADSFELDISRWVAKVQDRIDRAPYAFGYALLAQLQHNTPVVTGRLRAAWQLEVEPDHLVISNSVVYARRVNDGFIGADSLGREYHQVGHHMVEQTIAEAPAILDQVLRDLGQ